MAWGSLKPQPLKRTRWSFTAGAGEEADFRAGLFKAGPKQRARQAARGGQAETRALGARRDQGEHAARVLPKHRLKPGLYVYAIRMSATMNSNPATVLVSRPFRVGTKKK